jgi:hypothetical protein
MILVTVNAIVSPAAWQIPLLLFLGSMFTGFSVVATGLYVARIYKNGLNRPNAIVRYQLSLLPQSETDGLLRSAEASISKRSLR